MCRLFGFRSNAASSAHRSLLRSGNALRTQSKDHPDGWGIGWWSALSLEPQLQRGAGAAFAESDFEQVARMLSAHGVIAHVRKASVGKIELANSHPFRWGRWLFAHNGTIARFSEIRQQVEARIAPTFLAQVQGDTDSERCFALFLTELARDGDPSGEARFEEVAGALARTVAAICELSDPGAETPSSTNFLVGNGKLLVACRRGRTLYFSTYKQACSDRSSCSKFSPECEAPPDPGSGRVNHLIVASERMSEEDVWTEVPEDGVVGVDERMELRRLSL